MHPLEEFHGDAALFLWVSLLFHAKSVLLIVEIGSAVNRKLPPLRDRISARFTWKHKVLESDNTLDSETWHKDNDTVLKHTHHVAFFINTGALTTRGHLLTTSLQRLADVILDASTTGKLCVAMAIVDVAADILELTASTDTLKDGMAILAFVANRRSQLSMDEQIGVSSNG